MHFYPLFSSLIAISLVASCEHSHHQPASSIRAESTWEKQRWMEKASRILRAGDGLGAADGGPDLIAKSPAEIADAFMADQRFAETILDFNLYHLGFKTPKTSSPMAGHPGERRYEDSVFASPQAIAAAQAAFTGGNFSLLYDMTQPFFIGAFSKPAMMNPQATPQPAPRDLSLAWLDAAEALHDTLTQLFVSPPTGTWDRDTACRDLRRSLAGDLRKDLRNAGLPPSVWPYFIANYHSLDMDCQTARTAMQAPEAFARMQAVKARYGKLRTIWDTPQGKGTGWRSAMDIKSETLDTYGLAGQVSQFSEQGFWTALPNSSTNFNRKRAAYMLRTHFCDNLTPVSVSTPEAHAGTQHATDPKCYACHYKLDPMAGFFRTNGLLGASYEGRDALSFDDGTKYNKAQFQTYLSTWAAPSGSGREWNVGYIRSAQDETLNQFGSNLSDLMMIARQAPEAKVCLVKRMAAYVLGANQVYDEGWIESLAGTMSNDNPSAVTGSQIKNLFKQLVISKTFSIDDPDKGQCYDFAPGAGPSGLPCAVAFSVNKSCANGGCHKGAGAAKHLDLSQWIQTADGGHTFVHKDQAGVQIAKSVTFQKILDRLSTTDDDVRMPLGQDMDNVERAALFQWATEEASHP